MKFEFAKYTEITELAFEVNPPYKNDGFVRFFICPDVWDFWLVRILKGYEFKEDEGYVNSPENYILERNKIPMGRKNQQLSLSKVKQIIEEDDGGNWDLKQSYDINELIEMINGGFGINNLKTNRYDNRI